MKNEELDKIDATLNLYVIICTISISCNFIVFWFMKENASIYTIILRKIALYENMYMFSKLSLLLLEYIHFSQSTIISYYLQLLDILKPLTFNNIQISFSTLEVLYYSIYSSSKMISIILNIFLCSEVNTLLRNPFSRAKTRKIIYILITGILGFLSLIGTIIIKINKLIEYESYLLSLFHIIYGIFILFGLFSLFQVTIRFCINKPLVQSFTNLFVIRHFLYVLIYFMVLTFEIMFCNDKDNINNMLILSTGIIMFLIRMFDFICTTLNQQGTKTSILFFIIYR